MAKVTKTVTKIKPQSTNELLEVDMAIRDSQGRVIKDTYATQAALTSAANAASTAAGANSNAISGLQQRVGTAEDDIDSLESDVSGLDGRLGTAETDIGNHGTRLGTLETFKTNTESALTDINSDITNLEGSLDEIERVANGAHNTFVIETLKTTDTISTPFGNANNTIGSDPDVPQIVLSFAPDENDMSVFTDVTVPEVLLSSAMLQSHPDCVLPAVVFIPTGLTAQEKATIASKIPSKYSALNPQLIEVRIGDNILIKQPDVPDRWISGIDKSKAEYTLSTLEAQKMSLGGVTSRLSNCESKNNTQDTAISGLQTDVGNLQTAVAGKADAFTKDTTPTQNSSNPITSGAVYSGLAGKQSNLGLTTESDGYVEIDVA